MQIRIVGIRYKVGHCRKCGAYGELTPTGQCYQCSW
jgi:hypothetical protein